MSPLNTSLQWRKVARTGLAMALSLALCLLVAPQLARATALGYDYWGPHVVKGVSIPSGQLTAWVFGDGTRVDGLSANFGSGGNLCNWQIAFQFYDEHNVNYARDTQRVQHNCTHAGAYASRYSPPYRAREGRVCIRLYRDFARERLASVCHSIHR